MKSKALLLLFLYACIGLNCYSQEKSSKQIKEEQKLAAQQQTEALLTTKEYVFIGLDAYPTGYRTASLTEITDWDAGFFGGAGLGVKKTFNEKMFITLEYEWDYLSNTAYVDGFVNSAMVGIGMNF